MRNRGSGNLSLQLINIISCLNRLKQRIKTKLNLIGCWIAYKFEYTCFIVVGIFLSCSHLVFGEVATRILDFILKIKYNKNKRNVLFRAKLGKR